MNKTDRANQAFLQVAQFLDTLQKHGLKHILISPGSRSTPLTLAAATLPKLQKKVILDERSAGFTALGIGKSTRRPAALICTSGTAAANYFPAVIEACKSGVPMLLLTADRPAHLHHKGTNQTIDQRHLFGNYPVYFHNISETVLYGNDGNSLCKLAAKSIYLSQKQKGPVHLNFPFRKPLEPEKDFIRSIRKESNKAERDLKFSFHQSQPENYSFDRNIVDAIQKADRPLIITGQLADQTDLKTIFNFAEQLKAPVLSEQGIGNDDNAIQGFEGFLRNEGNQNRLEPDLILRLGRQPAAKSLLQTIKKWNPQRHICFSDTGRFSDIGDTTTDFIHWKAGQLKIDGLSQEISGNWLKRWKQTETRYFNQLTTLLGQQPLLTDGQIYQQLASAIPGSWTISFSNSFPARDHSMFGRWNTQAIYTNRGASGIDGITSTAVGVNIGSGQPGILFTGDLAFLHDIGALLNHQKVNQPLIIVVINNRGGSIFRMLPVSDYDEYFEPYFETPQQADLSKIAESYGIDVEVVGAKGQLAQLNMEEIAANMEQNIGIIECKTDPDASMDLRNKIWNTDYGSDN